MDELEERINNDIKNRLSEYRYKHSVGVMKMAGELAKFYNLDIKKARIIGLAHDIAKQMTDKEIEEYTRKYNIKLDELELKNRELIHSKLGADICKREYNFDDEMANAVLYHTTGNPNMDLMAKIIFIADKVEENRVYDDLERRRKLAFENIDQAIIETINYTTTYCIERGDVIHLDAILTRNKLIIKNFQLNLP